jgi:hypothetical protein
MTFLPNSPITFDLGATTFPNTGFTSVPAPGGGSAFVVATAGDYEFDFYVTGTSGGMATEPITIEIYAGSAPNGASVGRNYQFVGALNPTLQQTCVGHGIISLSVGQYVSIWNRSNSGTNNLIVTNPAASGNDAGGCNRMFALNRIG